MFFIGIDPHKASHTAALLDCHEQLVSEVRARADRSRRDRLLAFAAGFEPRCWAIEGASGTGALLAQQLVAAGERVLEDHSAVLRLLAKRHHDLVAHRTRAICRRHTLLCQLIAAGLPRNLSATRAATELRRIRPDDAVGVERRRLAAELLAEVRRTDTDLVELKIRIAASVIRTATSVTEVFGVGPIMAACLIGYSGDVRRLGLLQVWLIRRVGGFQAARVVVASASCSIGVSRPRARCGRRR